MNNRFDVSCSENMFHPIISLTDRKIPRLLLCHNSNSHCDIWLLVLFQASGKYKQKGRDYVVEDGDIIFFKFNAGAGLQPKKK